MTTESEIDRSHDSLESGKAEKEKELDVDDVLNKFGGFGRFQILLLIAKVYLVLTIGQHFVLSVFIGTDPPWRCINNSSSVFCAKHYGEVIGSDSDMFSERCRQLNRSEWEFTTATDFSYVTEFDLTCTKTAMAALASSAVYLGGIFGSMIAGSAADAYGRKPVLIVSLFFTFAGSLACSFITQIWQLTLLRAILGAANVSCYFTAFVMLSEFVTPSTRTSAANVYIMTLTWSHMAIDLWSYYERRWRKLQLYSSFPCLFALVILCFISESPRWLLATKKTARVKEIIRKIAKINGVPYVDFTLKTVEIKTADEAEYKYSYIDLVRNCRVLLVTFCVGIQWLTIGLVYYSLALEASSLGGNMWKTFALTALADMPSFLTSAYTCDRFGRKTSNLVSLIIAGVLVGTLAVVPQTVPWRYLFNIIVVMIAKFFTENAFNGIYTWSFEIFPTVLRSQGISICVIFQRIGLLIVPFLTTLLQSVSYILPFVFMFTLSVGACALGLLLPETNKKPTRERYEDLFEKNMSCDATGVNSCVNQGAESFEETV